MGDIDISVPLEYVFEYLGFIKSCCISTSIFLNATFPEIYVRVFFKLLMYLIYVCLVMIVTPSNVFGEEFCQIFGMYISKYYMYHI